MLLFYGLRCEGEGWSGEGGCNRILTLGEPRLFADIVSASTHYSSVNKETSTFRLDAIGMLRGCIVDVSTSLESVPGSNPSLRSIRRRES
jgi:hypothetical protein